MTTTIEATYTPATSGHSGGAWHITGRAIGADKGYQAEIRECPCDAPKHCGRRCKGRKCTTHKCEISPFGKGIQVCHGWHQPRIDALTKALMRLYR